MLCTIYFIDTHEIYILMNKPIYVHYAEKDCSYLLFTIMHLVYYCKFTQFVKKIIVLIINSHAILSCILYISLYWTFLVCLVYRQVDIYALQ